jgi:hypothetical protein
MIGAATIVYVPGVRPLSVLVVAIVVEYPLGPCTLMDPAGNPATEIERLPPTSAYATVACAATAEAPTTTGRLPAAGMYVVPPTVTLGDPIVYIPGARPVSTWSTTAV